MARPASGLCARAFRLVAALPAACALGTVAAAQSPDETADLVLSPTSLEVSEGAEAAYTVRLATQPTGEVTVAVGGAAGTDLSVSPTSLTFTTSSWDAAQTVTVSAGEDYDAVDDETTLTHEASGGGYGSVSRDLPVRVADDESASLVLLTEQLGVREGEGNGYWVRPASEPTATVTVAVAPGPGTDLTLNRSSLTFTPSNWSDEQWVWVRAAHDADAIDDTAVVSHVASGGDYESVTRELQVRVADDDTAGLVLSPASLGVREGDGAGYTVKLSSEPTASVTVAIGGAAGTDLVLDETSLTFTTSTWDAAQTVAVTAGEDPDGVDDSVTLTHEASGGDYESVRLDLDVTVFDDDTAALVLPATSLGVSEGASARYTVGLSMQPTGDVTVAIGGAAGTDLMLDKTSLTFTTSDWDAAQTVTVTAGEDADGVDDEVTLTHVASGGGYASVSLDLLVTVADDERNRLVLSESPLRVVEGSSADVTVRLSSPPTAAVTVGLAWTFLSSASADKSSLTFTPSDWDEPQTVTVSVAHDANARSFRAWLRLVASGGGYESVVHTLVVDVEDDDTAGLVLSRASLAVPEGAEARYTVSLATQPVRTQAVTVAIGGVGGTDLTLDRSSLTFTPSTWNTAQTVTVSAAQDDDAANDEVRLTHAASGGDYGGLTRDLDVTVLDDELGRLLLSPADLFVDEGASDHYTARLSAQPAGPVTATIAGAAGTDLTLDVTSLTFTPSNWSTAQTVTVSAADDDDALNDAVTLRHTVSRDEWIGAELEVTVVDDERLAVVLSPRRRLEIDEGTAGGYTVRLSAAPTETVGVAIRPAAGAGLTLGATSLTFTTADWATPQSVTVSAAHDADAVDDSSTVWHVASGGAYDTVLAGIEVTVIDDETAGLVLSPSSLGLSEGADADYAVRLSSQPTAAVTVTTAGTGGTDLTLDVSSLTFTTSDWASAQTVTVSAGHDVDATDDEATLTHAAAGGDYGAVTRDLAVTVFDDERATLALSASTLRVGEGADASYTVRLSIPPTATVTVAVAGASGTDLTLDVSSLTFTTSNWASAQTVTVSAGEDADAVDDEVTLTHSASGGGYDAVSRAVGVTVDDDETAGLVLSPTFLAVDEGADASYAVRLSSQPTGPVTVAVSIDRDRSDVGFLDLSLDESSLTFTTSNWSAGQTVTVSTRSDYDTDHEHAVVTHEASGADYTGEQSDLRVAINDELFTIEYSFAEPAVSLVEGAETAGVEIVGVASADRMPPLSQTIAVASRARYDEAQSGVDYRAVSEFLRFRDTDFTRTEVGGEGRYTATRQVDVELFEDRIDEEGERFLMVLEQIPGGSALFGRSETVVTIIDDDERGVVVTPTVLTVDEGGDSTYRVVLTSQPTDSVTVEATVPEDADVSVDATSLTFTVGDWDVPQAVVVTALPDADAAADDPVTLTHSVTGGDYGANGVTADSVAVTIAEVDSAGLVLSPIALGMNEGAEAVYTVALSSQPTAAVRVSIGGAAGTDLTLDSSSLTFTTSSWDTAQSVTVTAARDADAVNDEVTLTHTASGGDYGSVTGDLPVTVVEAPGQGERGLLLSPALLNVHEGAAEGYTARLGTQPAGDVVVSIGGAAGTDLTLGSSSLTFTTSSWDTWQTVTVTAGQDADAVNDEVTLTHTASGGDYDSVSRSFGVTVDDDETVRLALSKPSLSPPEGGGETYTVRLGTQPTGDVAVSIMGAAGTDLTLSATSLTFTTSSWDTWQTVTVTAARDADTVNDEATLTHAASGGDYGSVTEDLPVTVTEAPGQGGTAELVLSPALLVVPEGAAAGYSVKLATQPTDAVTVSISGVAGTDLTLDSSSLTFTTSSWNAAQTVTVSAGQDDDAANDEVTLEHTASGGGYASVSNSVTVTVGDDETAHLVLSKLSLSPPEGGSETYAVALSSQPTGEVTVSISGVAGTDLTLDSSSLTFTRSSWNTAQTVRVSAGEDADALNDEATLSHEASGGDYAAVDEGLPVTVNDDETARLVLPSMLVVGEGSRAGYAVRPRIAAGGDGDGVDRGCGGDGPVSGQDEPDVHDVELGHGADGDGDGGRGRRRGERRGDADAHGVGRRLRLGDRESPGEGGRRRGGGPGAVADCARGERGRGRGLHGGAGVAADGVGDGVDLRRVGDGPDAGLVQPDVHDVDVGHGADGDGDGSAGRRRGERRGDADAHGVGRRLPCGDRWPRGDGGRGAGSGADRAGPVAGAAHRARGRRLGLHGEAGDAADGVGDGVDLRRVGDGPDAGLVQPDVHAVDVGHGADGDG